MSINHQPSSSPRTMSILVIIGFLTLLSNPTIGKSCSKTCFSTTFSLSNDTRYECVHRAHCSMKANIKVIQRGSFDEAINITLVGYGVQSGRDRSLSLKFQSAQERIEYSCSLPRVGPPRITATQGSNSTFLVGNVYNISNILVCSWVFTKDDYLWPTHQNYSKVDLVNEKNFQIALTSDNTTKIVAWDLSKLPIYRMQFLRCCYKQHHGGAYYLLIANQTSHESKFYLQAFRPVPKSITVQFTNPKGGEFMITCNGTHFNASVQVAHRWSQMRDLKSYEIYQRDSPFPDFRCVWSQPLVLKEGVGEVDTRNGRYNLEITADRRLPYREVSIDLRGSARDFIASFHLIAISFAFTLLLQF